MSWTLDDPNLQQKIVENKWCKESEKQVTEMTEITCTNEHKHESTIRYNGCKDDMELKDLYCSLDF